MDDPREMKGKQRPSGALVTFVVVAYNQEKFIREAVQGAFSQTYEPLEIVLSDDCSTDQTFEIMQEMASNYSGPHSIRLVRNPKNLGVFAHAIARGKQASGEIVIGAAGDDISEPQRAAKVVDCFVSHPDAGCVFSWVTWIDESGAEIVDKPQPRISRPRVVSRDDDRDAVAIIGCSAAYKRWVFGVPINPNSKDYAEDMVFSFYLDLVGADVIPIELPLVRYRIHAGAATNIVPSATEYERKNYQAAVARMRFLDECEGIATTLGKAHLLDADELDKARATAQAIVEWRDLSFTERLKRVVVFDYPGGWRSNFKAQAWKIIRLLGRYPKYQPRLFLSRFQKQYRQSRELTGPKG